MSKNAKSRSGCTSSVSRKYLARTARFPTRSAPPARPNFTGSSDFNQKPGDGEVLGDGGSSASLATSVAVEGEFKYLVSAASAAFANCLRDGRRFALFDSLHTLILFNAPSAVSPACGKLEDSRDGCDPGSRSFLGLFMLFFSQSLRERLRNLQYPINQGVPGVHCIGLVPFTCLLFQVSTVLLVPNRLENVIKKRVSSNPDLSCSMTRSCSCSPPAAFLSSSNTPSTAPISTVGA